jgi:hypothetical protein
MAGNTKNKRKSGRAKVNSPSCHAALPIIFRSNADDERTLKLMPHTDLAEMREGRGTDEGYWTIVNRLNWASTMATMVEFSFDPTEALNNALDAALELHRRFETLGRFVLKADELKAIGAGLTLADDMHDATTRRQHRDALHKFLAVAPNNLKEAA